MLPNLFQYHVPKKPLSDFVGGFWYWRGHAGPSVKETILPTATVELVINLRSGRASDAGIAGPRSKPFIIERFAQEELLGIHFNVGGAFPFLGFPCDALSNFSITLVDLWGEAKVDEVLSLLQGVTAEMKFYFLEEWLPTVAKLPLKRHPVLSFALQEFERDPALLKSAKLAERLGLSQRRFIRLFRDEVGLAPKHFCRMRRFQEVIRTIGACATVDWLDVALSHGYFDQAHFIHDFREFSGLTPGKYLGLRTEHLRHVLAISE